MGKFKNYLIRNFEHEVEGMGPCWWKPKGLGYTNRIPDAARYTKAQAEKIVGEANRNGIVNEKMVPEAHAHLER